MLPTDQQPIATCKSYVFLHATIVSLIKLIFYMKNKKTVHLKLQHRISKKNSFSRYLGNAKSGNVFATTFVWYCLSSRPQLFCKKGALRNFPKLTGKHLRRSVFLKNLPVGGLQLYLKETPAQVFSREFCAPNQCIKVDNSTQMITEVDLDIQRAARGNLGTSNFD